MPTMAALTVRAQLMMAGRFGLGAACLAAPNLVGKALGFPHQSTSTRVFIRMLGVRDAAVGLVLLATAADRDAHRRAIQIAGLVDLGDVASIALGALRDPAMRTAALRNLPFAGGSALFSFWAARATPTGN